MRNVSNTACFWHAIASDILAQFLLVTSTCDEPEQNNTNSLEIDLPSLESHTKIPGRVKKDVSLLLEAGWDPKFYVCNSPEWLFQIKIPSVAFIFDIPRDYPFRPPKITLASGSGSESLNNKLPNMWTPSITVVRLVGMTMDEITKAKQREASLKDIENGYVNTLEEIKTKYLHVYEFGGRYPEFQKERYGLWCRGSELGYKLFYIEGDCIHFVYQPKSKNDSPIHCKCDYAVGQCVKDNDRYEIHLSEQADRSKTHRLDMRFDGDGLVSLMFFYKTDDSTLDKIIPGTLTTLDFGLIP